MNLWEDVTLPGFEGLTRAGDPETSYAAAAAQTGRTERLILALFEGGWEATDDEIADELYALYAPTVKTARSRLSKAGLLVDSGLRRPSQRGRDQIVWRAP